MSDYITCGGSIDENRVSHLINAVPPKAKWSIGPEFDITFYTTSPMPNWFHRTMQRLVLNIHWRKV